METLQVNVPHKSEASGSFTYELPQQLGTGGLSVDTFASGLRYMHLSTRLRETVVLESDAAGFTSGFGFCLQ